jgi:L-alanine-DL-glutamate epimerase-like enolase superfamily enzyme
MFAPWDTIGRTANWVTQLRAAVSSSPVLGVEYHHRLSVAEAASFCQRMPPDTLDWLEVWDGPDGERRWEPDEVSPVIPMLAKDHVSYDLPAAPGLGVEFDEAAATREPFKLWNVPNLKRRDGSVQNW